MEADTPWEYIRSCRMTAEGKIEVFYTEKPFGPEPPPPTAIDYIVEYADDVLCDLFRWTEWHRQRAVKRGLPKQWGLDAIDLSAIALCEGIGCDWNDEALEDAGERLAKAITAAKDEAAHGRRDRGRQPYRDHQAHEVEDGYLRSYERKLNELAYYFQNARCDPSNAWKHCHEASRSLLHHPLPTVEGATCTP